MCHEIVCKACSEHSGGHHQHRSVTNTSSPSGTPPLSPVHKSVDQESKKVPDEEHILPHFPELPGTDIDKQGEKDLEINRHDDHLRKELQKEFDLININNPIVSFEEVGGFYRICICIRVFCTLSALQSALS